MEVRRMITFFEIWLRNFDVIYWTSAREKCFVRGTFVMMNRGIIQLSWFSPESEYSCLVGKYQQDDFHTYLLQTLNILLSDTMIKIYWYECIIYYKIIIIRFNLFHNFSPVNVGDNVIMALPDDFQTAVHRYLANECKSNEQKKEKHNIPTNIWNNGNRLSARKVTSFLRAIETEKCI